MHTISIIADFLALLIVCAMGIYESCVVGSIENAAAWFSCSIWIICASIRLEMASQWMKFSEDVLCDLNKAISIVKDIEMENKSNEGDGK